MIFTYIAQQLIIQPSGSAAQTIQGPLDSGLDSVPELINRLNIFLIPLASIILFFVLIWGGYDFLMSGGNPDKVSAGKAKMTTALIGFVLLVASYFLARFAGLLFGLGS